MAPLRHWLGPSLHALFLSSIGSCADQLSTGYLITGTSRLPQSKSSVLQSACVDLLFLQSLSTVVFGF